MIEINGSIGEGGGQIMRTALSLSCILKEPCRIYNIRAKRPKPGMAHQHLEVANALAKISTAKMEGAFLGSASLSFEPDRAAGGRYSFNIQTAGSAILLAQALLPALLFAERESRIFIRGGTHVPFSPTFEYFKEVFLPAVARMGAEVSAQIRAFGFYPAGGGEIEMAVKPAEKLKAVDFSIRQGTKAPNAVIVSSSLPEHVAKREKHEIMKRFSDAKVEVLQVNSLCPGNALTLYYGRIGSCAVAKRGVPAEEVAREAIAEFEACIGFGADIHLADQLLPYCALAEGGSKILTPKISNHARTNMEIIRKFLPKADFAAKENTISVEGVNFP